MHYSKVYGIIYPIGKLKEVENLTIKELLKMLVETEELDERMAIVEENAGLFEEGNEPVESEELVALQTENEAMRAELVAQKQKYRDRFFSGVEKRRTRGRKKKKSNQKKKKSH